MVTIFLRFTSITGGDILGNNCAEIHDTRKEFPAIVRQYISRLRSFIKYFQSKNTHVCLAIMASNILITH